jgi:hypothetical protein
MSIGTILMILALIAVILVLDIGLRPPPLYGPPEKNDKAEGNRPIATNHTSGSQGAAVPLQQIEVREMEEHETRRKIIREWMKLPRDMRRTEEQVAAFAKGAVQQNEFQRSHRDPYRKVMGWLLPRLDRS